MPFTVDGEWAPQTPIKKGQNKPVKTRLVKRGKNILTVILNLNLTAADLTALASSIKKRLGCGGAVKGTDIEIQGDHVLQAIKILSELGIKSS